jgi:hypothetical protein
MNKLAQKANYPQELIDPRDKETKDWHLQYGKAAWSDAFSGAFYWARDRYHNIRLYARAEQPVARYQNMLGIQENDTHTWLNLDWKPLPIIPKFRRIGISRLGSSDYKARARAVDPLSVEEDNKHFKELEAKIKLREQMQQINPGLVESTPLKPGRGEPMDDEEMELYQLYTYRNKWSQEMELCLRHVSINSNSEEEMSRVRDDLFDFGVGAIRERFGAQGEIVTEHVPVQDMVVSPCRKRDFSDLRHAGVIRRMTLGEVENEAGDQLSHQEKRQIAQMLRRGGNKMIPSPMPSVFDNAELNTMQVDVLDLEILSTDVAVFESRVDSRGNEYFGRAEHSKSKSKNPKYKTKKYRSLYGCKWIINTNFVYDYGRKPDQPRSSANLAETRTSFHIYAPDFYEGRPYGVTERMQTHADAIQIAWLKLQQHIAQAKPKGIAIDLQAFEDINYGAAGQKMDWRDLIKMHGQLGSIAYRSQTRHGQHRGGDGLPIHELENGLGRDTLMFVEIMNHHLSMLRQITGINEMVDGSSPNPRALSAAVQVGVQAANNALRHLKDAEINIFKRLSRSVSDRIKQALARGKKFEGMIRSVGSDTMEFLSASKDLGQRQFIFEVVEIPTDADRAEMLEWAKAYAGQGLVSIEDYTLIKTTDNLLYLSHILAHRVEKRRKQQQEESERLQMLNGQVQTQAAQAAEAAKQQTIQLEGEIKMRQIQLEKDLELRNKRELAGFDLKKQEMKEASSLVQEGMRQEGKESPVSDSPEAVMTQ